MECKIVADDHEFIGRAEPFFEAVERFEWHYTPKHGSWLDMAESELAVLATQCLNRRIENRQTLDREIEAWLSRRNGSHAKADWRFATAAARIKLKRVYPAF